MWGGRNPFKKYKHEGAHHCKAVQRTTLNALIQQQTERVAVAEPYQFPLRRKLKYMFPFDCNQHKPPSMLPDRSRSAGSLIGTMCAGCYSFLWGSCTDKGWDECCALALIALKHVYQICEKIRTRLVSISHLKRANHNRTRILGSLRGSCGPRRTRKHREHGLTEGLTHWYTTEVSGYPYVVVGDDP